MMKLFSFILIFLFGFLRVFSQTQEKDELSVVNYEGAVLLSAGRSTFAPFYMSANRNGVIVSSNNALISVGLSKKINKSERFSYGFGAKLYGGYGNGINYERYDLNTDSWGWHKEYPPGFWIDELYGEIKWRSLFLSLGQMTAESYLVNNYLSSGDLTRSANARPVPQLRGGFIDFQNIPFTKGWLQIQGELSYGKFTDSAWWANHSELYNSKIASGIWYTYRRLYFRTNPKKPFSATFGAQSAAQFGGKTIYYSNGEIVKVDNRGFKFVDIFKILFPSDPGETEDFAMGNTLGSYDLRLEYKFKDNKTLAFYLQSPWEDGSGLAKRNGWDGLYGLEYKNPQIENIITGAVIEYLDLTNQSGPIHWAPGDHPGTGLTGEATGADDYYNNAYYNPYANYGMGMGNAMVMSPVYNQDGYMAFIGNRMRGVHIGLNGNIGDFEWKLMSGWRKAYGNGFLALLPPKKSWSFYAKCSWNPNRIRNWVMSLGIGMDRGNLPCNSFGAEASIVYKGNFSYGK